MNSMPRGAFSSQEKIPSGYKKYSSQQFTPEQLDLFRQLFSQIGPESDLFKLAGGDQGMFDEMEAPALRQFGELQGNLASRFSGMGMGGQKSSGFQNTMNSAAQDFAGQLQSNRQNLQRQAMTDLMGMSNSLLGQRPFETGLAEKPKSFGHEFGSSVMGGLGKGLGSLLGGLF